MGAVDGRVDILGIGNAIVDVLAPVDDEVILAHDLPKGGMTLIEAERADALSGVLGPVVTASGGSCANTMVAAASFGAGTAFVGKVSDDALGEAFALDIREAGVSFASRPLSGTPGTARCLIMVSPDGQRTMSTYLGACVELGPDDIDPDLVSRASVTYLEGYLWDRPRAKDAFRTAMSLARRHGRQVALTLSDPFCVQRHRAEFLALVRDDVDILFANEDELLALYRTDRLDAALEQVGDHCAIAAVTRSEKGSLVAAGGVVHEVPAEPVSAVVDSTGAGDAYAAGFLYGLTRGLDVALCARLGSIAAAEVISHFGARPQVDLSELAAPVLANAAPGPA